ncbi:MAG: hypothetical protein EZS28_023543 [Streblomastix strix]|uniref:EF-hand domain-containing protein n=1 Tax=Streblomastix strix TaxID=222440 RepID=A0A5J4VEH3_9EUKA|nr:MAG: hypothetical protein EZS28_023543 [Streblomastix strix]
MDMIKKFGNPKKPSALPSPAKGGKPVQPKKAVEEPVQPAGKEDEQLFSDLSDEELLELFTVVDSDGGGTISREELKDVMMKLKVASTEADMERIINQIDEDGNGEIDPDEFIEGFRRAGRCKYRKEEVQKAFDIMSRSDPQIHLQGTGTISVEGMLDFINKFSPEIPPDDEMRELLKALPIDPKTKTFTYENFIATMIN